MDAGIYKSFVTPTFKKVTLPILKGTEKQISYANSIRDKYTNIFIRKVQLGYNPLSSNTEEINILIEKFQKYVDNPIMKNAYAWIENHCPRCGCVLAQVGTMQICSNELCDFKKVDSRF